MANLYELLEQLALARFQRERLAILEPLRGRIQHHAVLFRVPTWPMATRPICLEHPARI